jgi:hypothetical protein
MIVMLKTRLSLLLRRKAAHRIPVVAPADKPNHQIIKSPVRASVLPAIFSGSNQRLIRKCFHNPSRAAAALIIPGFFSCLSGVASLASAARSGERGSNKDM